MKIKAIKTHKIQVKEDNNLLTILDKYITRLEEGSIVAITSKIVALCEGRVVGMDYDKDELVKEEADLYLPKEENMYNLFLTIKDNVLAVSAGIDESNANGVYVLWPKNAQRTANEARNFLKKKFGLQKVGVIITDSKTTPLRWGVSGIQIAYSGFKPINDLIGKPDIFGRKLKVTKVAVADNLAVAAALVMGEGSEQTPLAVISGVPFVKFSNTNPSKKELDSLKIEMNLDVYAPILKAAKWLKKT